MMNALQRMVATLRGESRDRAPVLPVALMQPAKLLQVELQEYQRNGELIARGQLKSMDHFGYDGVFGFPHVVQDVTPWGAELIHFKEGPPSVSKMSINDFAEIPRLVVPNPESSPQLQQTLKALSILKRELAGKYPVIGGAIAPFSLPSMLMGTGKFLSLLFDDPEQRSRYLPKLLDVMVQYVVQWANMQAQAGADAIVLADGIASNTVLRREQFLQFAYDSVKDAIGQIRVPVIYEAVGAGSELVDLIHDAGAQAMILDYTDRLAEVPKRLGHRKMAIMGNINNIASLKWSNLKMEIEVKRMLFEMGDYPFIASFQGPEVPFHMPFALIEEMVNTVKKYGRLHHVRAHDLTL